MQDIDIIGDADSPLFEQFIQSAADNIVSIESDADLELLEGGEILDENGIH